MESSSALSKGVLLVVDDDPKWASHLSRSLAPIADAVLVAANAFEAVALAKEREIHAVLTDLFMAGGDGIQLIHELRLAGNHVPVVVLTGAAGKENVLTALKLGAVDYFEKPCDMARLERVMTEMLKLGLLTREAERELGESQKAMSIEPERSAAHKKAMLKIEILRKARETKKQGA